jgi:hypothetical protein
MGKFQVLKMAVLSAACRPPFAIFDLDKRWKSLPMLLDHCFFPKVA